ncbi:MAG: pyridoxamine 5'-phosphate oxidase family protein [Cyclobacteriaceae bacterium]|nr:pyridoxamine 5'-phosphate oxidase family protein [Cyclobacteriaceae bacterium]
MAIALNDFVREVLNSPCFGFIGTLNKSNQPVITRVFGFKYDDTLSVFTMYTFAKDTQRLVDHLNKLSKVSATLTNAINFKTLQFKGTYRNHYLAPDEEMIYAKECNIKQAEIMKMLGISNEVFANWKYEPSVAIAMNVDALFDQTPKINTGNKIN